MVNTQLDTVSLKQLYLPYNRISSELSMDEKIIRGLNTFNTLGGKIRKRPGTIAIANSSSTRRLDRLYGYQTVEASPKFYWLGSFWDTGTSRYQLYYNRPSAATGWVLLSTSYFLNNSMYPHEVGISRGVAYIRSFNPTATSGQVSAIFDGTGGTIRVRPWGISGPTTPAAISGRITRLSGALTDVATTINVVANFSPAVTPNFVVQIDDEQINITSTGGGTNWTGTRGYNGTTAAAHDDDSFVIYRDWATSDHAVDVITGWIYVYAYKSITGHISVRSPRETNPDKLPSVTFPFIDKCPKITVQGTADTTNIPTIVIYRSQDGGGTFYKLKEISNTGAGSITFEDKYLETGPSGGTFNDPVPDELLDSGAIAPSLTTNSIPPINLTSSAGYPDIADRITPIGVYASRLWYGIGNYLYYSANEEVAEGIPEESFPSGITGNFFKFQFPITNVIPGANALYVFTTQNTYKVTGVNRETFNVRPLFDNIGGARQPRAAVRVGDKIAFLTHDYRVGLIDSQDSLTIISDDLFTDLLNVVSANTEFELTYFGSLEKDWLIVSAHNKGTPSSSRQWIFDFKLSGTKKPTFWNAPWTIKSTAVYSGIVEDGGAERRLVFYVWDGSNGRLVYLDHAGTTARDVTGAGGTEGYDFYFDTHLFEVPAGNHVNERRSGALAPVFARAKIDRTLFSGDADPDIFFYYDDFWTKPVPAERVHGPTGRQASLGYKSLIAEGNQVSQRTALGLSIKNCGFQVEIQGITMTWNPDQGVTE